MKILAASEDTGSVKEITCVRGTDTSKKDGVQPRSMKSICDEEGTGLKTRVAKMEISGDYLVASRLGATLCVYDTTSENYDLLHVYHFEGVLTDDKPIALLEDKASEVLVVAYESGKLFLVSLNNGKFDLAPIETSAPTNSPITCLAIHPTMVGTFACGGRENDAQVFRLYTHKLTLQDFKDPAKASKEMSNARATLFKAKNVKNDHLDLRCPIWISQIQFLDDSARDSFKFITVTRYGQLRIYDTAHGKRPVKDYPICDKPILAMTYTNAQQDEIIVTDTHSLVGQFSLSAVDQKAFKTNSASAGKIVKPVAKLLGKYTGGNTGAVFDLDVVDDLVATGGLDRYVRVYELGSREVAAKVYIGTQINSVIILETEDEDPSEKRDQDAVEGEEEEDIWKQLGDDEDTQEKVVKRKRLQ